MKRFDGKIAVITGGGSGIGAGICKCLAKEGATVIVCDVNMKNAQETVNSINLNQGLAEAFRLDVTNEEAIQNFGKTVKAKYGNINYWVNNAGISKITPFFNHTNEIWDTTMNINLKAQYLCCKVAIEQMLELETGSIVNMSSQSGKVGTDDYQAYCASKFGVIGLTQSLAKEFGPKGIRVNSVCPGVVYTPMWELQKKDYARKKDMEPEDVMKYFSDKIPLKRLGSVEDVANVVAFLLSDEAAYLTGQAINVNGGDIMF